MNSVITMRSGWTFLLLLTLSSAGSSFGGESASEILRRVKERYEEISDARIRFSETVTFERTGVEHSARGDLWMEKENRYRVELNGRVIVTDGETVWSYSDGADQVIVDDFKQHEGMISPEKILTGAPEDFLATHLGRDENGLVILKLLPREESSAITSLRLWVDEGTWLIRKTEILEFSGKNTVYRIEELSTNTGLDASVFSFKIPDGVEVVDLR
jgi:outer membrane lipoprotein carrier protein